MRFAIAFAALSVWFVAGCGPKTPSPPARGPAFQAALATLRIGMSKQQVESVFGKPSFAETYAEWSSQPVTITTWPKGASEVWQYEYEGSVEFDANSTVRWVYGRLGLLQPEHPQPGEATYIEKK